MKFVAPRLLTVLCLLLASAGQLAQGRDDVLSAIPDDVVGFAVIHNIGEASRNIGELAKIAQAPAPNLLILAKGFTGLQKGLDEQGDLALILTSIDPKPIHVILVPVANVADFFAALNVKEPETGVVEAQIAGAPSVVGCKGSYAAIASVKDRESLEKFLTSTTNLTTDASLAAWVGENRVSVVITSRGVKQSLPKLTDGVRAIQAQMRRAGGPNGQPTADALNLYVDLFTAAENELEQFGVGMRIDSAQTVDLVSRAQFTASGKWSKWVANAKPTAEDLLGGLEAKPFVFAMGGSVPQGAMEEVMKVSVKIMQNQPAYKLTPEEAKKYADLASGMMKGVKSIRMMMGVTEPGDGLYGNTTIVMTVDDTKGFLDSYEKSLVAMHKFAVDINSPAIPVATCQRTKVGDIDALEVSMAMPKLPSIARPGGPDPQEMMKLFIGGDGKLTYYVAPADEHTVVTAYISPERLKEAIESYKSKKPGLSADADVAKVAAKLPAGSQLIGYMSFNGMAKTAKQIMAAVPGAQGAMIPDFPDSPPFGFAAKFSPTGVEGHWIVTSETLRTIGDVVAKTRAEARERRLQQQQR
jgi:hypothetical protein